MCADFETTTTTRPVIERSSLKQRSTEHANLIEQSSGTGKSRLMDEYATSRVGIIYTIRTGKQSGYPTGDLEVTNFLRSALETNSGKKRCTEHANVICLLAATFRFGGSRSYVLWDPCSDISVIVHNVLEAAPNGQSFSRFFFSPHDQMTPDTTRDPAIVGAEADEEDEIISARIATTRSDYRQSFIQEVINEAEGNLRKFDNEDWRNIFNKIQGSTRKKQVCA
jgi:hypothetical protein